MKTWSELYRTFARQSAMVSNAEANIVLEEFSHKILKTVKAEDYSKVSYSWFLLLFCFSFYALLFHVFFDKNSSCMLNTHSQETEQSNKPKQKSLFFANGRDYCQTGCCLPACATHRIQLLVIFAS